MYESHPERNYNQVAAHEAHASVNDALRRSRPMFKARRSGAMPSSSTQKPQKQSQQQKEWKFDDSFRHFFDMYSGWSSDDEISQNTSRATKEKKDKKKKEKKKNTRRDSVNAKQKTPCKYYYLGCCFNGSDCRFYHDNSKNQRCHEYQHQGRNQSKTEAKTAASDRSSPSPSFKSTTTNAPSYASSSADSFQKNSFNERAEESSRTHEKPFDSWLLLVPVHNHHGSTVEHSKARIAFSITNDTAVT